MDSTLQPGFDPDAIMSSQMAKKMMERREKLAFGSLDVSKPMPAANYVADVSNTSRPKCDTKTDAGNAGNEGNEGSAESIDNQSLVLSPVGPVPKLLGPHNKQELSCGMLQLWFAYHLHIICISFACHLHVMSMSFVSTWPGFRLTVKHMQADGRSRRYIKQCFTTP